MGTDSKYFKEITDKLDKLFRKEQTVFASYGVQVSFGISIFIFVCLAVLEMLFHFSSTVRTVLFVLFAVCFLALLTYYVIVPVLRYLKIIGRPDYFKVAREVGRSFPSLNDNLLNAMQLVSSEDSKQLYSDKLIDAAFQQIYQKTVNIDFSSIVNFKKAKNVLKYFVSILIASLILIFAFPSISSASFRLVNFNKAFIQPPEFSFDVVPGNTSVTKGENVKIKVNVYGGEPKSFDIAMKDTEQTNFEFIPLQPDSNGTYSFEVKAVRNSFKYFARAENVESSEYFVNVIDRPIVKNLEFNIISPSYSGIPTAKQKDNGNVTALKGSKIKVNLNSTKALKNAYLLFNDSSKVNLNVKASIADGSFTLRKDDDYKIILTDREGNQNLSPITYSLKVLYDAFPTIEMVAPNKDVELPNDNRVPLEVKINDDYGFTKLLVHYRLSASKYKSVQKDFNSLDIPINKNQTEQDISYIWNLTPLELTSEDVVMYYLEVYDNDVISGPKSAKTQTFAIRVPSLNEILAAADKSHEHAKQELDETYQQAEELKQNLENLNLELKQNKKDISWEEKQKIQKSLDDFKKLQQKSQDIKKDLSKMQQNLQEHNLLSKETLEKYMELQKLMDEFSTDEMKKAMERLQNVLQNLNRQQIQNAMQDFKFNEDQFAKAVERTINLLKKVQVEQKIDELKKRTEMLSQKQNQINKTTDSNNLTKQNERNELSEKQNEVTKELNDIDSAMSKLSEKMRKLENMPQDEMNKMKESFEKQNNPKLSQNASQNLKNQQKSEAQQNQQQLSQNLQNLDKQIQKMQSSMTQKNQLQTFKNMMKIVNNLVSLSKQQEDLKNKQEKSDQTLSSMRSAADKQDEISRNLDKVMQQMSKLSQKTFAISPEMGKALGDAKRDMNNSIQSITNNNSRGAVANQESSMESLNQAASMMKYAMEGMMKGGQGQGGFMSLMQQLRQMSQKQMNLNNLTQMLQRGDRGNLTMEQQAQLQRLAAQQDLIRKSLDKLNREAKMAGESKRIPADLNEIGKEMEQVVTDMNTQKLNDKVIQRQERILSRMLEAQKSVYEKDYEKKRESGVGVDVVRKSPAELHLSNDNSNEHIVDELNKAVQEGYTRDYQELIRKYFEALQKQNVNK